MKRLAIIAAIAAAFIATASCAAAATTGVMHVPTIASMKALGPASATYSGIIVDGYNSGSQIGGGYFQWNATSTASQDSCAIFQATGVTTGRWIRTGTTQATPELCGAYGDLGTASDGVANGTTTFTSASANCTAALAAGQNHIIIMPKAATANAQVNTTFTCNSATSFHLAAGPAWSDTAVQYFYGHDDGAAFTAFNTVYGSTQLYLGRQFYLITSLASGLTIQTGLQGALTTQSIIVFGGLTGPGLIINAPSLFIQGGNFGVICAYAGTGCINFQNMVPGGVWSNINSYFAQTDCFLFDGTGGIESVTFQNFTGVGCGTNAFDFAQTSPGYLNVSKFINFDVRGVSKRVLGGHGVLFNGTAQMEGDSFDVMELDAQWDGNASYKPFGNAIYFNNSAGAFNEPIEIRNASPENTGSGGQICATCAAVGMNFNNATVSVALENVAAASLWGAGGCPKGTCGILNLGIGGVGTLFTNQVNTSFSGILYVASLSGAGTVYCTYAVNAVTNVTVGTLGTCAGAGGTFTTAGSVTTGVAEVHVTNTSGATTTIGWQWTNTQITNWNTQ